MTRDILNGRRRPPTHPGELLKEILPHSGLSEEQLAARLEVEASLIRNLAEQKIPVDADLAYRLGRVFDNGPEVWLGMQQACDVWEALQRHGAEYQRLRPLRVTVS